MSDSALTGGCLCGGVRFELTGSPLTAGYCHCTRCQRRTGTASSAQARIDGYTLRLLQGEKLLEAWRHPEGGHEKLFCGECGAHLFSRDAEDHTQMSVRMGAFDSDPGIRPSWRSFVAYAAPWEPIPDDGLDRFSEAKPRTQTGLTSPRQEDEAPQLEPLRLLERWLAEARAAGLGEPGTAAFVTVGQGGRPSARTVLLKRLEEDTLVFTSALWTRKAREIEANPHIALLFYWPTIGRQVHITGRAVIAERELAVELFAQRERSHQVQTLVSRQGEPIEDIAALRARHAHLMEAMESPPGCPEDWGAIRVLPEAVEFWSQAPDRMHDRLLYTREGDGWRATSLAP